jgi:hypothetical protein
MYFVVVTELDFESILKFAKVTNNNGNAELFKKGPQRKSKTRSR